MLTMLFCIIKMLVIEPHQIHGICQAILNGLPMVVETGRGRTGRIFTTDNIGQETSRLASVPHILLTNFIPYTPHDNARMVPIPMYQIHKIPFCPLIEEPMVSILTLSISPFVKSLDLYHKPHLIT